jgi:Colicin V production protein
MDMDLMIILVFITVFITGLIRGAGIELLRVLKVVIPFIILYFFGDQITKQFLSSEKISKFVFEVLPSIPYKNTFVALSTNIVLYILVYSFLAIFLWRLGKYVLDERIEYFFGKTNSIMGGIFSVIRMYIIMSILIIPFYALNFTNQEDPTTNFIVNHPPMFSKIGHLLAGSKPTLDQMNEISASFKIMDLDSFEKYSYLLTDIEAFLTNLEDDADVVYRYLYEEGRTSEVYETKQAFLIHYTKEVGTYKDIEIKDRQVNKLNAELNEEVENYQQVILWAYEQNVVELESFDLVVKSFIENYPSISDKTDDPLTIDLLTKTKFHTQMYVTMQSFLQDTMQLPITSNKDLLQDESLMQLLNEFDLYKNDLIDAINQLELTKSERELVLKQIERFSHFQTQYQERYKPYITLYDDLLKDVSFKYKLAFSIAKSHQLNEVVYSHLSENPPLFLFIMDSIDFLDGKGEEKDVYFQAGQLYIALFVITIDQETGLHNQVSFEHMESLFTAYQVFHTDYNDSILTINRILHSLFEGENQSSYMDELIQNGYVDENFVEQLYLSKEYDDLLDTRSQGLIERMYQTYEGQVLK